MPVDPNTGRIITTSNLGITEADAARVPRNQALGPSRTAQERKQIRTALLAQWEGLASNPVIEQILQDLADAETFAVRTYDAYQLFGGNYINLDRVEDDHGDPYYRNISIDNSFVILANGSSGNLTFELNFLGTNYHSIATRITVFDVNLETTKSYFFEDDGTTEDILVQVPIPATAAPLGTASYIVTISSLIKLAVVADTLSFVTTLNPGPLEIDTPIPFQINIGVTPNSVYT